MHLKTISVRESVIRQMTIQAHALKAVNLSQGFSDDDIAPEVRELAHQAIGAPCHQYTDPFGSPLLRRAIAAKLEKINGIGAHPDRNIVVTCGATEGMIVAMEALLEPGSEIIAFAPLYENYAAQCVVANVTLRALPTFEPEFGFTRQQLEALCSIRTAAVLLCNPCNPTGKVFTAEELQMIVEFACDHDLLIFSDETYEYLIWPGYKHISIASLPRAASRTVSVTSMGKTYSVTGWRVGYLVADGEMVERLRLVHDFHTVTAPHPFQVAMAGALALPDEFYAKLRAEFWKRKLQLAEAVSKAGMTFYEPGGSYFLWCEYSRISDEDDQGFAARLLQEVGIAVVPGSVFYPREFPNPKRIRLTFSKSRATIEEAARRMAKLG